MPKFKIEDFDTQMNEIRQRRKPTTGLLGRVRQAVAKRPQLPSQQLPKLQLPKRPKV